MCQFLHCECLLYHCGAAERLFLGGLSCWVRDVRAKLQWCVRVPFFSIRVISRDFTFFFDESCTVLYKQMYTIYAKKNSRNNFEFTTLSSSEYRNQEQENFIFYCSGFFIFRPECLTSTR